jgi:hypothetical protein
MDFEIFFPEKCHGFLKNSTIRCATKILSKYYFPKTQKKKLG